jgi:hypothetical protein
MKTACFSEMSEMSVASQQIIRRWIPEDSTIHNRLCENLKSYVNKH